MIIKNARVFTEDGSFMQGDVVVKDGRFDSVLERTADTDAANDSESQEIIDASGLIMIPGLVDIHFHGCKGADMCDGTTEALDVITAYEASVGVTSVCPATMTIQRDELLSVMKNAGDYNYHGGAHLVGINMEGPFISPSKKGAQAYTMGIKTIMQAKKILIVASGEDKAEIVHKAFFGPITPQVPASVLQLHNDVTLVADEAALSCL